MRTSIRIIRSRLAAHLFPRHLWREIVCVFCAGVVFFSLLALNPSFPDPDSFYHARIAALMSHGPVMSFPWLPLTSLSTTFIDHHFLYHILLIPFIHFTDPLIGLKVATILFAASFIAFFYFLMREGHVHTPVSRFASLFFIGILLINSVFTFRLNLAKIPAVSLFFFFAGIVMVNKKNLKGIFGLSFLFVWLYGGWPIMPMMALLAWIALSAGDLDEQKKLSMVTFLRSPNRLAYVRNHVTSFVRSLLLDKHWSLPVTSISGALSGLILNPYFPTNIQFYWVQTIKIAVLNIVSNVPVGSEWYPAGMAFIPTYGPILMILVFAFSVFFLPSLFASYLNTALPKRTWQGWLVCLLTLSFFILTLKSRRYGEYFTPLATLFCASTLSPLMTRVHVVRFWALVKKNLLALHTARGLATGYLVVAIPAIVLVNIMQITKAFQGGYTFTQYAKGMRWLAEHTPDGSLVFHHRWDDFPVLFYHNQHNRYISGLDPRFLFENNKKFAENLATLEKNEDITSVYGYRPFCLALHEINRTQKEMTNDVSLPSDCVPKQEQRALAETIRGFGARTIVLTHLDDPPTQKIRGLPGLTEVYRDDEMVILTTSTL